MWRPVRKRLAALVEQATSTQRSQIEELLIQNRGLQAQIDLLPSQYQGLQAQIDLLLSQYQGLQAQIDLLLSQYQGLRADIDALCSRIEPRHEQVDSLQGEVSALHDGLFRLERIVTGTSAARSPGASKAVSALSAPAVAVIIPTFNRPKFLPEAVESVQRQTFGKWELVIVGDGSGEETAAAADPYLDDPRIKFVRQERGGSASARNRGIIETHAPLIAYLDDDNLWYPDFLERALDCMATHPDIDVLYGALVTHVHGLDRSCILWRPFSRETLLTGNFIDTSVIVHRRTLVDRYGGWDSSVNRLCDWDLMLRYTADKPAYALTALAAYYRICDDQRTSALIPDAPTKAEILRRRVAS